MSLTAPPPKFTPPEGWDEIYRTLGDPRPFVRDDGRVDPEWERQALTLIKLPAPLALSWDLDTLVTRVRCNRAVAAPLSSAFGDIHAAGLWPLLREFGGCYEFRRQRGSSARLSLHAFGAAIDLNPSTNEQGTAGNMDARIVDAFRRNGWQWGGTWAGARRDPMHFQFALGV